MQPEQPRAQLTFRDMRGYHWYEKIENDTYVPPSTLEYKHLLPAITDDLLNGVVPVCQRQLAALPVSFSVGQPPRHHLMLPWTTGSLYPFAHTGDTGSMKRAMLVKILTYLLQHGPEHATWLQTNDPLAKDETASFYGMLEVRIPKDKVEAFSALCGKMPLVHCWKDDDDGPKRKTVIHAWHMSGLEEESWGDGGVRLVFRRDRLVRMLDRVARTRSNRHERIRLARELEAGGEDEPGDRSVASSFKRMRVLILDTYRDAMKPDVGPEIEVLMTSADFPPEAFLSTP